MLSPEEQIAAITRAAFEEAGSFLVDQIRQEISRAFPPSSEPNTPPHLRTGDLALGVRSSVDQFWDGVTLTIISEMFYSRFLRDGTSKMSARDYMGDAMAQRLTPIVVEILQKHFGSSPAPVPNAAAMVSIQLNAAA